MGGFFVPGINLIMQSGFRIFSYGIYIKSFAPKLTISVCNFMYPYF